MMKTITLVANNRLHYLTQSVEALKRNNLAGYTLFIGVEPGDDSVVAYCRSLDFMPIQLTLNPTRLGVAANPLATITRAFDAGSEFNVALEDDLVLSPDALDLANWFFALPEIDDYFCLSLFNYGSDVAFPADIETSNHFAPLGWAVTAKIWRELMKPNWMSDGRGWDFSVNQVLHNNPGLRLLRPKLARANHIGREGGEHCSPEFHDEVFSRLPVSEGSIKAYSLASVQRPISPPSCRFSRKLSQEITLVVVSNQHRRPLITDYLTHLPHILYVTTDYDLPPCFQARPEYARLSPNQIGPYRCFRGHQDALRQVRTRIALVLEDDAVPNRDDWIDIANRAREFLPQYELISLHSREVPEASFLEQRFGEGLRFLDPRVQGEVWVLGSLAYLIDMSRAQRLLEAEYDGLPTDLFLCRRFKFGIIDPSPFNHDRSQGSLIDCSAYNQFSS